MFTKSNPRKRKKNTGHSGRDLGYGIPNGKMMKSQLTSIRRSSTSLINALRQDDKVPAWVLSKAAVALSDLQTAENYILSKIEGRNRNPAYRSNKAEEAKGKAASVKKAFGLFGRGAKKAAIATGKGLKKGAGWAAYQSKLGALNANIVAEKAYLNKLLKCGRDLEVAESKVKETKAWKQAKQRIAQYEERIKVVKADYAAKKTNPRRRKNFKARALPKHIKRTPKSRATNLYVYPKTQRYPIGDLYHARTALVYVLSPNNSRSRKTVAKAVQRAYPQYNWGAWWNREKKRGVPTWNSLTK